MADMDELTAIRRMMDEAQRTTEDNGKYFVTWGLITTLGLAATYAAVVRRGSMAPVWAVWGGLTVLGWLVGLRWGRLDHRRARVRSVGSAMVADTWVAMGLGTAVLVFAGGMSGTISVRAVPSIVCTMMGVGTFASAAMYGQLPLRAMAVAWWAASVLMLLRPGAYTLVLMAALVLTLLVVPGAVLWMRARGATRAAAT